MSDLISRQDAIDAIRGEIEVNGYSHVADVLEQMPSAQPERKTGRWIPQDHNRRNGYVTTTVYFYPKCSECGRSGDYGMNYCPNCGADMRGDTDEVD